MNIELKNVKIHTEMSEETTCFSADIWIDGKKAGQVRNSGTGGCHGYSPISLVRQLTSYAATLPRLKVHDDVFVDQDADCVIGTALLRYERRKELRAKLSSRIVYARRNAPGLWETRRLKKPELTTQLAGWKQQKPADVEKILNLLPEDEALELYAAAEEQGDHDARGKGPTARTIQNDWSET